MTVAEEERKDDEPDSIPLADLRDDLADGETDRNGPQSDVSDPADPADSGEHTDGVEAGGTQDETTGANSVPLSGLRDEMDRKSRDESDREQAVADAAFAEEQVEPVDSDGIWADLLMEDENPEGHFEATETQEGSTGTTLVISKRICERCRYLEAPPELKCTHDGTTIHELVDMGHVRVSSCPMVGPSGEETRPKRSEDR